MKEYHALLEQVLHRGIKKIDRTGVGTISTTGAMIQHDMRKGFPLLTTKFVSLKNIAVELEGFIKANSSKQWLKDRGCNIWNNWSTPAKRPEGMSQEEHDDLGTIYGVEWRDFNGQGADQLRNILQELSENPNSRRLLVSAWNPLRLNQTALPPCHFAFQLVVRGIYLDIVWYQRSADVFLGVPYDLASYALLLKLICCEYNYVPGWVTGFFADTHIYVNHMDAVAMQLVRMPFELPDVEIRKADKHAVFDFDASTDVMLIGSYKHHGAIKVDIAI